MEIKCPKKIEVFSWRLLLNRLQPRDELGKKEVIKGVHNLVCSLCLGLGENNFHLFLLCPIMACVWQSIGGWIMYAQLSTDCGILDHLNTFGYFMKGNIKKNMCLLL